MGKIEEAVEFAAHIGLDWGDKEHSVCLQVAGSKTTERWKVKHTVQELEGWAAELRGRFGGRPVALAVELSKGPVVSALLRHDFIKTGRLGRPAAPRTIPVMPSSRSRCWSSTPTN
jgi:hypothetical protein